MMSGLQEYLLLDLRRDRSSREQEAEMGVDRYSRRESLAESSEKKERGVEGVEV